MTKPRFSILLALILSIAILPVVLRAGDPAPTDSSPNLKRALFAGGCFWCTQYAMDHVKGVKKTIVGFTGGETKNPTYEDVSTGETGHLEAIEVFYDPSEVTYGQLVTAFWTSINPTQEDGQFTDTGSEYRTAIFYADPQERAVAEASKKALEKSGRYIKPVVTKVLAASSFYPADESHQKYYQKHGVQFQQFETASGRVPQG